MLIAGLIGATVLGLVGALMAIPVAAAFNVLLNERLLAETAAGIVPGPGPEAAVPAARTGRGQGREPRSAADQGQQHDRAGPGEGATDRAPSPPDPLREGAGAVR